MDEHIASILGKAEHPVLRRVIALWDEKRGDRLMPSRADFDPAEMKFALGDLSLYDVEVGPPRRFWCRLDGTRQVELFGVDCTGRYLDECFPADYYAMAYLSFSSAVDGRKPFYYQRNIPYYDRNIRYEFVMMPLSSDGQTVDKLLVPLTPHWD